MRSYKIHGLKIYSEIKLKATQDRFKRQTFFSVGTNKSKNPKNLSTSTCYSTATRPNKLLFANTTMALFRLNTFNVVFFIFISPPCGFEKHTGTSISLKPSSQPRFCHLSAPCFGSPCTEEWFREDTTPLSIWELRGQGSPL